MAGFGNSHSQTGASILTLMAAFSFCFKKFLLLEFTKLRMVYQLTTSHSGLQGTRRSSKGGAPSTQSGREKSHKVLEDREETFAGLKSTLQRFRIYFFQNPSFKDVESTS